MPFVPMRDGHALHVRVVGRGAPVLLLPGLGMSSAHWLPFVLPFAHRRRFFLPDFRGAGRSSHLRIAHDDVFTGHANDVRDVVAGLGLEDFLLGGISLGCTTALHMNHDGGLVGVKRYLHIDQSPCVGNRIDWPHGLFGPAQHERFASLRRADAILRAYPRATHLADLPPRERADAASAMALIAASIGGDVGRAPHIQRAITLPRVLSSRLPLSHLDDVRAYLRAYLSGGHDYRESIRRLTVPITLMVGMRSPLYPPEGQMAIARYAPHVRVVRFDRSGHVPFLDEPAKFMRELARFLD